MFVVRLPVTYDPSAFGSPVLPMAAVASAREHECHVNRGQASSSEDMPALAIDAWRLRFVAMLLQTACHGLFEAYQIRGRVEEALCGC